MSETPPAVRLPDGWHIDPLTTVAQVFAASAVLDEVWGGDAGGMPPNLLRALAHSGNYAVGLFARERMVGASAAFFAAPAERSMHSHITGILPAFRGHHVGLAVKQHQRAWALERGIEAITWTFDPLVARNAHFNLRTLGARVVEYLPDHYGDMDDGVNRGDESDRLLVRWVLDGAAGRHPDPEGVAASVAIPRDIETLRHTSAADAAGWRRRVRDAFSVQHAAGRRVVGFSDDRGYLFA